MNIFQVLVTLSYGDGVGNDTIAIHTMLKEAGYHTHIYAENIDQRISNKIVSRLSEMPVFHEDDIVIYHVSTGCELNNTVKNWCCQVIFRYHNITPPDFFKPYDDRSYQLCASGLEQVKNLKGVPDYCICDSSFNASDLKSFGYTCPMDVVPILIPFDDYETAPCQTTIDKYNDGWTNLVFVGRIAPNKKHEDILKIFAYYKKYLNPFSRLIFVGSFSSDSSYYLKLKKYEELLGVEDVVWTGHLKFNEILGFYKVADIFLCMSEHEGFCIPLVEAMFFQVPVVAFRSTAIPNTMQGTGAIIDSKDPIYVSQLLDMILKNEKIRANIVNEQNDAVSNYQYTKVKNNLLERISSFIEKKKNREKEIKEMQKQAKFDGTYRIIYDMTLAHKQLAEGYCTGIQRVSYELFQSMKTKTNLLPVTSHVENDQVVYYELNSLSLKETRKKIEFSPLDIILRPEINHEPHNISEVKKKGVRAYVIIHDLLCINLPEVFDGGASENFKLYLSWIFKYYDGCICVSEAVEVELTEYILKEQIYVPTHFSITHSHNGVKSEQSQNINVQSDIISYFQESPPVFFMLGTIEPRKNHAFVLDTFEEFWEQGLNYKLCIIGRIGWKVEEFMSRVKNHKELGKRLVFWEEASDDIVAYTCQHATALIQASLGEGFGLPLIEAGLYDLPLICSDIPVFREVAGEFALYFDPRNNADLGDTIQHFLKEREKGNVLSSKKIPISTWDEAAERVLDIII